MNFPEIVDIALPAEGVFHNLVIGARRSRRFTVASPGSVRTIQDACAIAR
jgi:3-polyprenyl-4-hydroxybenzoate decarboxylase